MLKASFVLDCDECQVVFAQAAATDRNDTASWWEAAESVRVWAKNSHWQICGNSDLCPDCRLDLEKQAEYFAR